MNTATPDSKMIIQFDGMCILCSSTVRFILKADRKQKFLFQTLQPDFSDQLFETVIVNDGQKTYCYFDAVLKIGYELGGIYRLIAVFRILPARWRKNLYLWVAKNRYRWFGLHKTCYLPEEKERERFI